MNRYLLVVTPGLERLLCDEISTYLGREISRDKGLVVMKGGIEVALAKEECCTIATKSRLVESVRLRLARFHASKWYELENGVNHLHLGAIESAYSSKRPELHISSHKSALYHTKAIEERILNTRVIRGMDIHSKQALPLHFYFSHDICTVSCAVGGFYKRGYRDHVSKAPLRETLAAAVAYASLRSLPEHVSYRVLDPFCGTGTLLQEWYSFTHGDDPASQRRRLLDDYSDVVERSLSQDDSNVVERNQSQEHTHPHAPWHPFASFPLQGSDSDGHAIKGAVHNTQRLLGTPSILPFTFTQLPFSQLKNTVDAKQPLVILSNVSLNTRDDV